MERHAGDCFRGLKGFLFFKYWTAKMKGVKRLFGVPLNYCCATIEQQIFVNWKEKQKTLRKDCSGFRWTTVVQILNNSYSKIEQQNNGMQKESIYNYVHNLKLMVPNLSCTWVCGVATPLCYNLDGGVFSCLLTEGFFCERFLIEAYSMSINSKFWAVSADCGQSEGAIIMYFLNFIWPKPSCLQFPQEVLEYGVIQ